MSDVDVTARLARAVTGLDEAAIDSCLTEIRNTHKQLRKAPAKSTPRQQHQHDEQWADEQTMERYERWLQKQARRTPA